MRLSAILAFGKKPIGFKYRGKNRVVKEIKPWELKSLKQDYERTEKNMLFLRYPYLTVEQSHGHMSHVDKRPQFWSKVLQRKNEAFMKEITIAERLAHLKVNESWD